MQGGWQLGPPSLPGPVWCGSSALMVGQRGVGLGSCCLWARLASWLALPLSISSARALGLRPWPAGLRAEHPPPARYPRPMQCFYSLPHALACGAAENCLGGGGCQLVLIVASEVPRCLFQSRELKIGKNGPWTLLRLVSQCPLTSSPAPGPGLGVPSGLEGSLHL